MAQSGGNYQQVNKSHQKPLNTLINTEQVFTVTSEDRRCEILLPVFDRSETGFSENSVKLSFHRYSVYNTKETDPVY